MKELKGDLWDIECDALCISVNGYVKSNGENVMGKGCAKQAAEYWPHLPALLGKMLRMGGNVVHNLFSCDGVAIVSFPVKPEMNSYMTDKSEVVEHMRYRFNSGDAVPGWACVAETVIIENSAKQLVEMADKNGWKKVLIPRVGCGAGELKWCVVKPILDKILDDRFTAVTFK